MRMRLTKTELRNTVLIASAFFLFLLIFNVLLYFLMTYQLTATLDSKIRHEMEHIASSFTVRNDSLKITRPSEFQESDLVKITENPFFLQIYTTQGKLLLRSNNCKFFNWIPFYFPEINSFEYFTNTKTPKEIIRTGYKKLLNENNNQIGFIQLSTRRLRLESALQNILYYNLLILPLVLFIIAIVSIFISKKTLKPVNSIIKTANRISAINLKERLDFDTDPDDEMSKLKLTLNNLFERLESQIQQISAFSDNASHQLMTPLTAINAELDYSLKKEIKDEELKQSLLIAREQSERVVGIIKSLLIMARTGKDSIDQNLIFSIESVMEKFIKPIYVNNNLLFSIQKDIYLRGRPENFAIVIQNLVDNAIKYSDRNSDITLETKCSGKEATIVVSDGGIGIPDEEKGKVFERFYRGKQAENIGIKGFGLGLSLVKSIILSMNGTIEILDNTPAGTKVILTVPAVPLI